MHNTALTLSGKKLNPIGQITEGTIMHCLEPQRDPKVSSMMGWWGKVQPMLVIVGLVMGLRGWCEWVAALVRGELGWASPEHSAAQSQPQLPGAVQSAVSSQQRDTEHAALTLRL